MNKRVLVGLSLTLMTFLILFGLTACDLSYLTHSYTPWETEKEATCAEKGVEKRTCVLCGKEEKRDIPISEEHGECEWEIVEGHCLEKGTQKYVCRVCGKTVETAELGPLGHEFGEWIKTTEETCTEDGVATRTCARCGATEEKAVPAAHSFGDWTVTSAATCTATGNEKRVCIRCGAEESKVIPALGHDYAERKVISVATCTESGLQSRVCKRCGEKHTETVVALGHEFSKEWSIDLEATCTEDGSKSHHCLRCGATDESSVTVIPAGHVFDVWTVTVEATCTEKGEKTSICSVCNAEIQTREIAALGHTYGDWEQISEPTCTEAGEKVRICSVCGGEEHKALSALGHKYSSWQITTPASCTESGVSSRVCERCNDMETKIESAIGHSFSAEWIIDIPASCETVGSKSHHCLHEGCVERSEVTEIAVLGHVDENRDGYCDHSCGKWMVETPVSIVVTIENKFSLFSEDILPLTYTLNTEPEEDIEIRLVKEPGVTVGEYAITGTWNGNPYYEVTFVNATYYIADKDLICVYDEVADGYVVTGYGGSSDELIIISRYSDGKHGLKAVFKIDTIAMKDVRGLQSVTVARSVEYLGNGVFSGCVDLTELIFEDVNGWHRLPASAANSTENWKQKSGGESTELADSATNANNFVNSDVYVDYYWYKR